MAGVVTILNIAILNIVIIIIIIIVVCRPAARRHRDIRDAVIAVGQGGNAVVIGGRGEVGRSHPVRQFDHVLWTQRRR